jgi:hypothetical protein
LGEKGGERWRKDLGKRGVSGRSELEKTTGPVSVRNVGVGESRLDDSTSESPRVMIGSERAKDPEGASNWVSDESIAPGLLDVAITCVTSGPRYMVFW